MCKRLIFFLPENALNPFKSILICFLFLSRCHILSLFALTCQSLTFAVPTVVFPSIHLLCLGVSAGYDLGHLHQRGNTSGWREVWMWWRWHVDSSNESLVTCHFFTPSPPLVNSSIRMHTIYKRNLEDIRGCKLSRRHHLNSIQFAFLFFFLLSLPPRLWMVSFCGECRKNKS